MNEFAKVYKNCKQNPDIKQSQKEMTVDYKINEINGKIQECIIENFYSDFEMACLQDSDCLIQHL